MNKKRVRPLFLCFSEGCNMKLNIPAGLVVKDLIASHGNNGFIDLSLFSHVSNVTKLESEIANTACTVHLTNGESHDAIYNRINIGRLFGVIPAKVRTGKVDWKDVERSEVFDNPKVYKEILTLYGVDLSTDVSITLIASHWLTAAENNPAYYGSTKLEFYDAQYNDIPFNLLTGFHINKFKGDWTLIPMQPYPVDSFLYTTNSEYDPNGDIFGEWERENPIVTSGAEAELLRLPVSFAFELLELYEKTPHVEVICLNPDAVTYNAGNAELLNEQWRITNPNSPIYNEFINVVNRDEMTTGIRTHMLIYKERGFVTNVDNPEYRWRRVN
jgi:hypothetical protein